MRNQIAKESSTRAPRVALAHRNMEPAACEKHLSSTFWLTTALALGLALPVPLRSNTENSEWSNVLAGVSSGKTTTPASEAKSEKKVAKPVAAKKASKDSGSKRSKTAVAKVPAKPATQ